MECLVYQTIRHTPIAHTRIRHAVFFVLSSLKRSKNSAVSIHLIGDRRMKRLNKTHRGIAKTTDVLSFSSREGSGTLDKEELGDIFLSTPHLRRQVRRFSISFEEEFFRMLVHGLLHLLGHDHDTKKRARRMFFVQEKMLHALLYRYSYTN